MAVQKRPATVANRPDRRKISMAVVPPPAPSKALLPAPRYPSPPCQVGEFAATFGLTRQFEIVTDLCQLVR